MPGIWDLFITLRGHRRRTGLHIDRRVHIVHILLIQLFPQQLAGLAKPLEMNDFPLPQELDNVIHIRVIREPQDVVISCAGFLFGRHILHKVRHGIALDLHGRSAPGGSCGGGGVDACGVIHEVGGERRVFHLIIFQVPGQLMHDRADHFQVPQFFRAYIVMLVGYLDTHF